MINNRDIQENGKLICEFMELRITDKRAKKNPVFHIPFSTIVDIEYEPDYSYIEKITDIRASDTLFHSNWEWIMPVVAKLKIASNEDSFLDNLHVDLCTEGMRLENQMDMTFKCDYISVENTYTYVVPFVKWYLKNKI